MNLFDPGPETNPPLSADAKRTLRNNQAIANGTHPLMGGPLKTGGGTCGNCGNLRIAYTAKRYYKCDLNHTRGPGTDVKLKWPGCHNWRQTNDDSSETHS